MEDKSLKIAIFTDTFLPQINGVTNTLDRLTKHFNKNNIEYRLFAPKDDKSYENKSNVYNFASIRFFLYPELRFALPDINKMKSIIKEFNPDLIHVVTPFSIGLCGLKIAKDLNIPLVSSYHTNFSEYLEYYNLKFVDHLLWKYIRWFHNHSIINYCPSMDTKQKLLEHGIKNIEIWGRGIDTELYNPSYRNNNIRDVYGIKEKTILLYVGRLAREKDLDTLAHAFSVLSHRHNNNIHLIIAGSGPYEDRLRSIIKRSVTFTGYIKAKKLAEIYASSDIFVFPSVTETYGNVILEAMASGLPVVASMSGGISENLINGYNGLEAGAKQTRDYIDKIEALILDTKLRKKLGIQAREYALSKSWDSVFDRLIESYKHVINCYIPYSVSVNLHTTFLNKS